VNVNNSCYIDFRKAFDSVEKMYEGTFSAVIAAGGLSEWFETVVGMLQGCVPLLFNIFLELFIARALNSVDAGVVLRGHAMNNLRFADDIAAVAENHLQTVVDGIESESTKMGMRINIDKTEVQLISNRNTADEHRRPENSPSTKVKVFETLVLSILLHNAETWTLTEELNKRLRAFEMSCLRRIAGVTRHILPRADVRCVLKCFLSVSIKLHVALLWTEVDDTHSHASYSA